MKKVIKQETKPKELQKPTDLKTLRKLVPIFAYLNNDPNHVLKEFGELYDQWIVTVEKDEQLEKAMQEKISKAVKAIGMDNFYQLADSLPAKYSSILIDLARRTVSDYDCKTAAEKGLAQIMANAFGRILFLSEHLATVENLRYVRSEWNGFYSAIGKEIDRATRQYTSALMALKQLKSPALKLSIKADSAFIAENQQLNDNRKLNSDTKEDEKIIDTK